LSHHPKTTVNDITDDRPFNSVSCRH